MRLLQNRFEEIIIQIMEQVLVTATCIERFMFSTIIHVQVVKYQNAFLKKHQCKKPSNLPHITFLEGG